ncbi:MAG TPA: hypothetical protein VF899_05805 [Pyrinomonadaceae bacterium]
MSDGGGDIIIKGGSCDLIFSDDMYPKDPGDPKTHKNKDNQKVLKVVITGDITFDSGDHPNGLTCEIHTYTR